MDASFAKLRADVEFALERIAPALRESWSREVEGAFAAWRGFPEYPLHQGARKLISEFYVRALKPNSFSGAFILARNVMLDYLESHCPEIDDVHSVSDKRWQNLAKALPLLFDPPRDTK